jgi:glutathionylspermidine synthase
MKRYSIKERINYKDKLNKLAFHFNENYWNETSYYEFTLKEILDSLL